MHETIFGYSRYYNVTLVLFDLRLTSFATIMHNCKLQFIDSTKCNNNLVKLFRDISCFMLEVFLCACFCVCVYAPCFTFGYLLWAMWPEINGFDF